MRLDNRSVLDLYWETKKVKKIYLEQKTIWGSYTVTFLDVLGNQYAQMTTLDNGMLTGFPSSPEGYNGMTFYGWCTDLDSPSLSTVNLKSMYRKDTILYPYFSTSGGGSTSREYVDETGYVYYDPDTYISVYENNFDRESFFAQYLIRDASKFYIELYARASDSGEFGGTENGRYYFCDAENDEPVRIVDTDSEDMDGDGVPDVYITIYTEYCHSTDIAVDFGGGTWREFSEAVPANKIVDCLDGHKPYHFEIHDINGNDVVCLCNDDGTYLVVGGRRADDTFVAVPPDEIVLLGTAFEVLPVDEY